VCTPSQVVHSEKRLLQVSDQAGKIQMKLIAKGNELNRSAVRFV
jgi:hypothetical protein